MLTLRLLAIIALFALSAIPFAVAADDESHPMSEGQQEEGAEGAEGPREEEHID